MYCSGHVSTFLLFTIYHTDGSGGGGAAAEAPEAASSKM
jgi:hypothetical protein